MKDFLRRHSALLMGSIVVIGVIARFGPAIGLVLGFTVLTPLELVFRRHEQPVRRANLGTDVMHFLFTGIIQGAATIAGIVVVYVLLRRLTIQPAADVLNGLPVLVQSGLALLLFEFFGYWYHRKSHEWAFLWRFHSVHHSSESLDWISAARLHPLEGFFSGLVIGPAFVLLGFRPITVPIVTTLLTLWAILLHANVRWRLGRLDGIVGTPEYHHWHHSNELQARNRNYSGLLPVLDRMFGTYYQPAHRRPSVYGIDEPMPEGWFAQMVHPFRKRQRELVPF